jgi:hypothetical protein
MRHGFVARTLLPHSAVPTNINITPSFTTRLALGKKYSLIAP